MSRGLFKPGQSGNPAGRAPGTPNKRSMEFRQTLEKHSFNTAEAMLEMYEKAMECFPYADRDQKPAYLKIAADMLKEMASYAYPKLKAIEVKRENHLDGMTPEQKLEAMKQAVALMENEMKSNEPRPVE